LFCIFEEIRLLTKFEVETGFLYASGFLPHHQSVNSIEVAIKVLGAKIIDNICISIEHAGHSVD
jgi:hypothetical protein